MPEACLLSPSVSPRPAPPASPYSLAQPSADRARPGADFTLYSAPETQLRPSSLRGTLRAQKSKCLSLGLNQSLCPLVAGPGFVCSSGILQPPAQFCLTSGPQCHSSFLSRAPRDAGGRRNRQLRSHGSVLAKHDLTVISKRGRLRSDRSYSSVVERDRRSSSFASGFDTKSATCFRASAREPRRKGR